MSVLAIADCHIGDHAWCRGTVLAGISERAREGLDALAHAVYLAQSLRVDRLVVLGDLFDVARPAPVLVHAVQEILSRAPDPVVLVGNHDQESEAVWHHACAPLAPIAQVVDQVALVIAGQLELVLVAPRTSASAFGGTQARITAARIGQTSWGRKRVLGLHLGLADQATPVHLRECNDAILVSEAIQLGQQVGAELVVAGNWHWPASWQTQFPRAAVVQIGTLCPHDFRDAGQSGWAVEIRDDGSAVRHEIPGPRFYKVASPGELAERWPGGVPDHTYVSVRHDPGQAAPSGPRIRAIAEAADRGEGQPVLEVDVADVEQVIVEHVRGLVPEDLRDDAERMTREIWRNAR